MNNSTGLSIVKVTREVWCHKNCEGHQPQKVEDTHFQVLRNEAEIIARFYGEDAWGNANAFIGTLIAFSWMDCKRIYRHAHRVQLGGLTMPYSFVLRTPTGDYCLKHYEKFEHLMREMTLAIKGGNIVVEWTDVDGITYKGKRACNDTALS